MRSLLRRAALLCTLPVLAACGSLLPTQARTYHVLQDLHEQREPASPAQRQASSGKVLARPPAGAGLTRSAAVPAKPAGARTQAPLQLPMILVSVNPASALYESAGIVYSRAAGERTYYQFATWTERPSARLGLMVERRLLEAIAQGAPLSGAALDTSGVRGDWMLGIRLIDLYHDTTTTPHRAVVSLQVELIDWQRRRILDRALFSVTPALRGNEAQAAVAAINQAMTSVLDQLSGWIERKANEAAVPGAGHTSPAS